MGGASGGGSSGFVASSLRSCSSRTAHSGTMICCQWRGPRETPMHVRPTHLRCLPPAETMASSRQTSARQARWAACALPAWPPRLRSCSRLLPLRRPRPQRLLLPPRIQRPQRPLRRCPSPVRMIDEGNANGSCVGAQKRADLQGQERPGSLWLFIPLLVAIAGVCPECLHLRAAPTRRLSVAQSSLAVCPPRIIWRAPWHRKPYTPLPLRSLRG